MSAGAAAWPVWLSPWAWSSSDWQGLTFAAVVVGAFVAWRHVKEARRLREQQARPFVVIDFHPVGGVAIEIRIKNVGTTLARDVQFKFDKPLISAHDPHGPLTDLNLFKNGIPSLPPGKEIKFFFDSYPSRIENGLPMSYEVHVSYTDPAGKPHGEPTVLDLDMYYGSGGITRHGVHDVHKQLEKIANSLKRWTDYEGLKVLSRADLKRRRKERDAELAARATAGTQETSPDDDSPT